MMITAVTTQRPLYLLILSRFGERLFVPHDFDCDSFVVVVVVIVIAVVVEGGGIKGRKEYLRCVGVVRGG